MRISLRIRLPSSASFGREQHTTRIEASNWIRQIHIPPPTWSIKDLGLHADAPAAEPLSPELLASLSRRALIRIPDDDAVRNDLAKMIQLIHQVVEWNEKENDDQLENLTAADLYDLPRGVTAAPLRSDEDILKENHPAVSLDKTISVGGHKYFAIKTQAEDTVK